MTQANDAEATEAHVYAQNPGVTMASLQAAVVERPLNPRICKYPNRPQNYTAVEHQLDATGNASVLAAIVVTPRMPGRLSHPKVRNALSLCWENHAALLTA